MTLPLKKALRIAPSSAFRSFIPAARNWKTGSSVKKTLNFLRHMRLTSWRIWRARDIILYFNDWDSLNDAWHFARFYIIGEDCINGTRKYISQILKTLLDNAAELTAYKVSRARQLFRLYSRKSITRWLLTCYIAQHARYVFYPQNLTATYRRHQHSNLVTLTSSRYNAIMRCGLLENDDISMP